MPYAIYPDTEETCFSGSCFVEPDRVIAAYYGHQGRAGLMVADPYVQLSAADAADGVRLVDRDTLLAEADVVTLHARVTEETTGFLDANAFARMKRGAMLETFAVEPAPPDERLLRLPNVTLTPHIAGASLKTVKIAARNAAEEVRRHLCGEPPLNPC